MSPLPHDLAIEDAILGCLLQRPQDIARAATAIDPGDFYKPTNGTLFGLLVDAWRTGEPHGQASLAAASAGILTTGDAGLLAVNAPAGCVRACERLVALRIRRDIVNAGAQIMTIGNDRMIDAAEAHEQAASIIATVDVPAVEPRGLWDLGEFMDRPESDTPWVIPGLFKAGWRVVVVATEGAGKTTVCRQIATAAASGIHPFMTSDPITPVPTLMIDLENPADAINETGRRMRAAAGAGWGREKVSLWHRPGGINIRTRQDRSELEAVLARTRPALVTVGPLYKMYSTAPRESDEQAASDVQQILDDLRTRFGFALLLEHHAPKSDGAQRPMAPFGSSLWLRWPELGLKLTPHKDGNGNASRTKLNVGTWRADRVRNRWPQRIDRGSVWPFVGEWDQPYKTEEQFW